METIAILIAIFSGVLTAILTAICLPLVVLGKRGRLAEDVAHRRRLADARMNARLLRFNL